jgi:hypothetical protein
VNTLEYYKKFRRQHGLAKDLAYQCAKQFATAFKIYPGQKIEPKLP